MLCTRYILNTYLEGKWGGLEVCQRMLSDMGLERLEVHSTGIGAGGHNASVDSIWSFKNWLGLLAAAVELVPSMDGPLVGCEDCLAHRTLNESRYLVYIYSIFLLLIDISSQFVVCDLRVNVC